MVHNTSLPSRKKVPQYKTGTKIPEICKPIVHMQYSLFHEKQAKIKPIMTMVTQIPQGISVGKYWHYTATAVSSWLRGLTGLLRCTLSHGHQGWLTCTTNKKKTILCQKKKRRVSFEIANDHTNMQKPRTGLKHNVSFLHLDLPPFLIWNTTTMIQLAGNMTPKYETK